MTNYPDYDEVFGPTVSGLKAHKKQNKDKARNKRPVTARPWHLGEDGELCDTSNQRVAGLCNAAGDYDCLPADAAHIVLAVNAHDALVAACEAALNVIMNRAIPDDVRPGTPGRVAVDELRAALAVARGQG